VTASEGFTDRGFSGTTDLETEKPMQRRFLGYCRELTGLKPNHRVLDVGCGWGFLAAALSDYLGPEGAYDGVDVEPAKIRWCHSRFRRENFRFQTADVANLNYNPSGQIRASRYQFPFPAGTIDLVVLRSVFTVMPGADAHNYISEIARILKPGGHCLSTLFLLNEESLRLMDPRSTRYFKHSFGFYRTESADGSHAVAYDETYFRVAFSLQGMKVRDPICYGTWCGRESKWDAQDMVVAVKEHGPKG
jgi:ubiquinone/menaquinone biosynthesis C-methylase UbiE